MAKLIILEGTRATGKSTLSHRLRQNIEGSTLINFTGFKEDGDVGLNKVSDYYESWLKSLNDLDDRYTIICDRIFFSELVYSQLYKSYDFYFEYNYLLYMLKKQNHKILLYFLSVNENDISQRIKRDKIGLFDNIQDTITSIGKQQTEYDFLCKKLRETDAIEYEEINTSTLTQDELFYKVMSDYKILEKGESFGE